jgi:hypothetical protein
MKTVMSKVTKLSITEVQNLDPITVILEDFEIGKGKIIIDMPCAANDPFLTNWIFNHEVRIHEHLF